MCRYSYLPPSTVDPLHRRRCRKPLSFPFGPFRYRGFFATTLLDQAVEANHRHTRCTTLIAGWFPLPTPVCRSCWTSYARSLRTSRGARENLSINVCISFFFSWFYILVWCCPFCPSRVATVRASMTRSCFDIFVTSPLFHASRRSQNYLSSSLVN